MNIFVRLDWYKDIWHLVVRQTSHYHDYCSSSNMATLFVWMWSLESAQDLEAFVNEHQGRAELRAEGRQYGTSHARCFSQIIKTATLANYFPRCLIIGLEIHFLSFSKAHKVAINFLNRTLHQSANWEPELMSRKLRLLWVRSNVKLLDACTRVSCLLVTSYISHEKRRVEIFKLNMPFSW